MIKLAERSLDGSNLREPLQVGAQSIALQEKVHELALANDLDEAGRLQLLDMMGEGGGAYGVGLVQDAARQGIVRGSDLLEDLVASRFGQGAGDARELPIRQSAVFGTRHRSSVDPGGFGCPGKAPGLPLWAAAAKLTQAGSVS